MDLLDAKPSGQISLVDPKLHLAKQVLQGEFGPADIVTLQIIIRHLEGELHPQCRLALDRALTLLKRSLKN
jgi:hypothetical protein